jgi:hypothetical protein
MPLNKRAWVVQETLLAPRVLFLCGSQVFWECYEFTASEEYPDGVLPKYDIHNVVSVSRESKMQAFGATNKGLIPTGQRDRNYSVAMWRLWNNTS